MKCEECCHAEMCKWIDELEGRGCDFLSQEPCDDAVSREDAIGCLTFNGHYDTLNEVYERLKKLPSVTQKYGKWIEHPEIETSAPEYLMFYECSECGDKQCFCKSDIHKKRFCNNCGAKMVEPQESEEISERNMKMWEEIFKAERGGKE